MLTIVRGRLNEAYTSTVSFLLAEAEGLLRELLLENVDWKKKIELAVSYEIRPTLTLLQS